MNTFFIFFTIFTAVWGNFKINIMRIKSPILKLSDMNKISIIATTLGIFPPSIEHARAATPTYGLQQTDLASQLKKYQEAQSVIDSADVPFTQLPSGVSYRQFREGKGKRVVEPNSEVAVEMVIRCQKFSTTDEPGGVKYFSTKSDTRDNELRWKIGSGALPPGLEDGMMGMKKNSLRRIELPSVQVFAARDNKQLPLPSNNNPDGQRRFKNLFKTDATLLFEVLVKDVRNEETADP